MSDDKWRMSGRFTGAMLFKMLDGFFLTTGGILAAKVFGLL